MKRATIALLALLIGLGSSPANAFNHSSFDTLLKKYVKRGKVDYRGIKDGSQAQLEGYLKEVATARIQGLSRNAKLAFYLNAYNALVIKAVVERYPAIRQVTKVPGFFDRIRYRVAGRSMTLNQLEKKLILPTFKDARVHFALVCAARSCPPLRARAFSAKGLDKVLDALTRRFINSAQGVRKSGSGFQLSQLFNWYRKDFEAVAGTVAAFVAKYHQRYAKELATSGSFSYLHYNWNLNK